MILEAFSKYLQAANPNEPAMSILARWLWERLSIPPETAYDQILHSEIAITGPRIIRTGHQRRETSVEEPSYAFKANSKSGQRLLRSLTEFAHSYEQQKWSRWVHWVKASDFNALPDNG